MGKVYTMLLGKDMIGSTHLEKADAPMGVVFGEIEFNNIASGYAFLKDYCLKNNIDFTDYPEDRLISTSDISELHILDVDGNEIKGLGCTIEGMDSDRFEVIIVGIPYPFYEEEFPHHVQSYHNGN